MKNYINTLRTGEILVDFDDYDVYVTEEGLNIPIPVTKGLREKVLEFIKNDLDTGLFKQSQIHDDISHTTALIQKINEKQQEENNRLNFAQKRFNDAKQRIVYLSDINEKNINQLGDIILQTGDYDKFIKDTTGKLKDYIDLFNKINNDSSFNDDQRLKNQKLMNIWDAIRDLMKDTNEALDELPSATGKVHFVYTNTVDAWIYDVDYSDFLSQHGEYSPYRIWDHTSYARACRNLQGNYERFIKGTGPGDMSGLWINGPWYGNINPAHRRLGGFDVGANILYPGFSGKINLECNDNMASHFSDWDLAEAVPSQERLNAKGGNAYEAFNQWNHLGPGEDLYQYILMPGNYRMHPGIWPNGAWNIEEYTGDSNYSDFMCNHQGMAYNSPYFSASVATYGEMRADGRRIPIVRDVIAQPGWGIQLTPRYTKGNSINGYLSPACPAIPVLAANYGSASWVSLPPFGSKHQNTLYQFRVGLKKHIRQTNIQVVDDSWNINPSDW